MLHRSGVNVPERLMDSYQAETVIALTALDDAIEGRAEYPVYVTIETVDAELGGTVVAHNVHEAQVVKQSILRVIDSESR